MAWPLEMAEGLRERLVGFEYVKMIKRIHVVGTCFIEPYG